jgi:hypothetical protein
VHCAGDTLLSNLVNALIATKPVFALLQQAARYIVRSTAEQASLFRRLHPHAGSKGWRCFYKFTYKYVFESLIVVYIHGLGGQP